MKNEKLDKRIIHMLNKISKFTFFTIFIIILPLFAQEKVNEDTLTYKQLYDEYTLYPQLRFLGGLKFKQGYNEYSAGIFDSDLENIISVSPLAKEEMKKFKVKRFAALSLFVAGLGVLMVSSQRLADPETRELYFSLSIGGNLAVLGGAILNLYADNHLYKAVWYYNKYILFEREHLNK
jgi:hypothetical protein